MNEKTLTPKESKTIVYFILLVLSILSLLGSLITLWQGIVSLKSLAAQTLGLRQIAHIIISFQNDGLVLISISLFLMLLSILFAIYSLLAKD